MPPHSPGHIAWLATPGASKSPATPRRKLASLGRAIFEVRNSAQFSDDRPSTTSHRYSALWRIDQMGIISSVYGAAVAPAALALACDPHRQQLFLPTRETLMLLPYLEKTSHTPRARDYDIHHRS